MRRSRGTLPVTRLESGFAATATATAFLGFGALAILGVSAWIATRGLDRTDEGFYLNAISHPTDDKSTILLFGYAYHPLWSLLDGDVVLLRWAGLLISLLAVGGLAWCALGTQALTGPVTPVGPARGAASLALAATALTTLAQLPPTPNYNTLALQGLALAATGSILAATRSGWHAMAGSALLGVAGWLTFLAKPTTAGVLAIIVLGVIVAARVAWRRIGMAALSLVAAGGLTLGLAQMSPSAFVDRMANGLATSVALGGHDHLLRRDPLMLSRPILAFLLGCGVVTYGLLLLSDKVPARLSSMVARTSVVGIASVVMCAAIGSGAYVLFLRPAKASALATMSTFGTTALVVVLGLVLACVCLTFAARGWTRRTSHGMPQPADVMGRARAASTALTVMLLLMPAAYSLGTNVNLWTAQGRAASFWILALSLLLLRSSRTYSAGALWAVPLSASLPLVILMLCATVAYPYRSMPLTTATTSTPVSSGSILLTPQNHDSVVALERFGQRAGIGPESWIVDLTGDSPASTFLLGAHAVGQAWVIGGYGGSEKAAALALENDRCHVPGAWVFVASSQTPRAIPARVLATVSRDLNRDYVLAGQFPRERWIGASQTTDVVLAYRPRHSESSQTCN